MALFGFFMAWIFRNIIAENTVCVTAVQGKTVFAMKLLAAGILTGFLSAIVFDTVNVSLPGGFMRKALNFAFILWSVQALPMAVFSFAVLNFSVRFVLFFMAQLLFLNIITAFVISGAYEEYKMKKMKMESDKLEDQNA
jgi:hypothetical protein